MTSTKQLQHTSACRVSWHACCKQLHFRDAKTNYWYNHKYSSIKIEVQEQMEFNF